MHAMDVDTAFLNATLEKDIWVQIPTGTKLSEYYDGIYKLLKSYMDSSRHHDIGIILLMVIYWRLNIRDWRQIHAYMFVKEIKSEINGNINIQYQLVALYVDDPIFAALIKNLLTNLEKVFEAKFKMKELNKIKQILGIVTSYT
jgi:Reverse transcriptase (RNA-dependent DNA polymerase)